MASYPASMRILTKNFVLLFVGNFIIVSVYFMLMTTMAYYAVNSYGADSAIAGLAASIFLVGGVMGRILCGRYGKNLGLKRLAAGAMIVQLAMVLCYFLNGFGIGFLIAVRLIHGLAFGIANTVVPAMAVNEFPPERVGEGTGYFMLSNSLGVGVGPMMSVLLVMGIDYLVLFRICLVLSVVSLGVTLLVRPRGQGSVAMGNSHSEGIATREDTLASTEVLEAEEVAINPSPKGHLIASIIDTSTFKLSVFMFLVAFSYSSLNAFLNSYAIQMGLGFFSPFVFLVYSVVLLISRPITGRLMDRYGENAVLYPSIASMGVGLLLAAVAKNPVLLLCCGIFMATGFGTCMSVGQAAATKISTCGDNSKTISTFFLLCDGGCGIGPFMLGFVVSGAGYEAMYMLCAAIAFCAVIYYHFVHGRHAKASVMS